MSAEKRSSDNCNSIEKAKSKNTAKELKEQRQLGEMVVILKKVFEVFDRQLTKWHQIDPQKEAEYLSLREQTEDIKNILYSMNAVDSKCSALLAHISLMFVVLGIFIVSQNHWIVSLLLTAELIAYIIVASMLIRCLDIMGFPYKVPPQDQEKRKEFYYAEVALRRTIYVHSLRVVYILTILLIPVILLKYIL